MTDTPPAVPFPVDPTTTVVNTTMDGIFGVALNVVKGLASAIDPPITANPIMEFIDDEIIDYVGGLLYKQFALFVSFQIIDYQVGTEVSSFKTALANLKAAQAGGDSAKISAALLAFGVACGNLDQFNGSGAS